MEHHVYFWLKEERQNAADRATFEQGLTDLLKIDLAKNGRWSVPAKVEIRPVSDQTWDYALSVPFASIEQHDAYQIDPDHDVFVGTFKAWWEKVRVSDLA